jgi:hypothetical protein
MNTISDVTHWRELPRDLRAVGREALEAGWRLSRRGGGHVVWFSPDGVTTITTAATVPGRQRGLRNDLALLRRAGLGRPGRAGAPG